MSFGFIVPQFSVSIIHVRLVSYKFRKSQVGDHNYIILLNELSKSSLKLKFKMTGLGNFPLWIWAMIGLK